MKNKNNDIEKPHFDISASVVKQLGEELVTDEVTAIMELAKNSYDADANWVRIEINTIDHPPIEGLNYKNEKGYILLQDDGFGMAKEDIINGWLWISFSKKRKMKEDGELTKKGRMPLGDKGLGRLSTQKLGYKLEMFTIKDGKNQVGHHVAFNWKDFNSETPLTKVNVYLNPLLKNPIKEGTLLIIQDLNNPDVWQGESVDKIKGQLSQLIFPYKDQRPFDIYLKINGQQIELDELNENARKHAITRFSFNYNKKTVTIDGVVKFDKLIRGNAKTEIPILEKLIKIDNGKGFFRFLTSKKDNKSYCVSNIEYVGKNNVLYTFKATLKLSEMAGASYTYIGKKEIADPGNFTGKLDEFSFNSIGDIENTFDDFAQFKTIIKNQIGVRIFRDGFGIKPFGLDGNDWLGLSKGQTSGTSFYGLRPNNVTGFVLISAKENRQLNEKTDREGFVDDPYSRNFHLILSYITSFINKQIENTKRSYLEYIKFNSTKTGGITSLQEGYDILRSTANQANDLSTEVDETKEELNKVSDEVQNILDNPLFSSEEKVKLSPFLKKVHTELTKSKKILKGLDAFLPDVKRLSDLADTLEPTILGLENQLAEFSELAGLGLTAEALSHEIAQITDRLSLESEKIHKKLQSKKYSEVELFIFVEFVRSSVSTLRKQISHLAPSLKYVREKREIIELNQFIIELGEYYKDRLTSNKIKLEIQKSSRSFELEFNKGKLTQIFDNLILNSEYWLKQKLKNDNTFLPKITILIKPPFVQFFDNGFGVAPAIADNIFQPFITNKPKGKGRGLGLFIVDQFLNAEGSSIFLRGDTNKDGNKYIFQIDFNNSSDE